MNKHIFALTFAASAFGLLATACGNARTPDQYAADTQAVLSSKNAQIKDCYEAELRKDKNVQGAVTVHFNLEPDTGKVVAVTVESAASPALGACVSKALEGLVLAPGDSNEGVATFTWNFTPGPTPPAPPAIAPAGPPPPSLAPAPPPPG